MLHQKLNQTFQEEKEEDDDAYDSSDIGSDDSDSTSEDEEIEHGDINGMDIPLLSIPADGQVVPSDVVPAASPGSQTLPGPSHTASAEEHLRLGLSWTRRFTNGNKKLPIMSPSVNEPCMLMHACMNINLIHGLHKSCLQAISLQCVMAPFLQSIVSWRKQRCVWQSHWD